MALSRDESFELAEWKRDRPIIEQQLASARALRQTAYVEKFEGQLHRTNAAIAKLERRQSSSPSTLER